MVVKARAKESWELAAERLVGEVQRLLDCDDAIVKALAKSLGSKEEAKSRLRQLEALVKALELELWRKATPADKTMVGHIAAALKKGVGTVLLTAATTASVLVTTDVHDALTAAETQADRVIVECGIEAHNLTVDDARQEHTASEVTLTPAELDLEAVLVDPQAIASKARIDGTARPETIAGRATVRRPQVVAGRASANLGFEATAEGHVGDLGQLVEHDEALPMMPLRGSTRVTGESSVRADADVAAAEGTVLPPTTETTDEDAG